MVDAHPVSECEKLGCHLTPYQRAVRAELAAQDDGPEIVVVPRRDGPEPIKVTTAEEFKDLTGNDPPPNLFPGPNAISDKVAFRQPDIKDPNPKDAIGCRKAPASTVSALVEAELGLAMLEGACKYGRHNYRCAPVRASIYYDAARRHLAAWFEGEDTDPDSGLPHVIKAAACLAIVRDAQISESLIDDRPPSTLPAGWQKRLNEVAAEILDKYPEPRPAYVKGDES